MKTRKQQIESQIKVLQSRLNRFTSVQFKSTVAGLILEIERLESELESLPDPIPATRTLKLETPRRSYRAWVAEISHEIDTKHGGFVKEFLPPVDRQFNKKGETSATFKKQLTLKLFFKIAMATTGYLKIWKVTLKSSATKKLNIFSQKELKGEDTK